MVIPSVGAATAADAAALHRITNGGGNATHHHRLSKRQLMDLSAVLELWLDENHGNLYPTRHQKERIALDTSMSYNQVNRWFANRRRKQQLQCDQYDSITPSQTPHNDTDANGCGAEPESSPLASTSATDSLLLSLSTTCAPATDANNNHNHNSNNNTYNNQNNNSEQQAAAAKLYSSMYVNWLEAAAWASRQQQQQQQQPTTNMQQLLLDNLLLGQPHSTSLMVDSLLFGGAKQKLALLDAHNLTEKEHLAVTALADLANQQLY